MEDFFRFVYFAIEQQVFLKNVKMTERTFLNICFVGLGVNALQWVEKFRAHYLSELDTSDSKNVELLSGALLEFARGNYEQVYVISSQAERLPIGHRQQLYGVQVKALTERYLLNQISAYQLRDYLRSADRFARYHTQVRANFKNPFLALIKILKKLIIMREGRKPPALIKARLNSMKQQANTVMAPEWLQEKIDQL